MSACIKGTVQSGRVQLWKCELLNLIVKGPATGLIKCSVGKEKKALRGGYLGRVTQCFHGSSPETEHQELPAVMTCVAFTACRIFHHPRCSREFGAIS